MLLTVLGFAPGCGKSRYIRDLRFKAFCPADEMLPSIKAYEDGDVVCVIVLEVKKESQRLVLLLFHFKAIFCQLFEQPEI